MRESRQRAGEKESGVRRTLCVKVHSQNGKQQPPSLLEINSWEGRGKQINSNSNNSEHFTAVSLVWTFETVQNNWFVEKEKPNFCIKIGQFTGLVCHETVLSLFLFSVNFP